MKKEDAMPDLRPDRPDLHARYGEIGISAVAAAMRYKGEARNPAYAPVVPDADAQARLADQESA